MPPKLSTFAGSVGAETAFQVLAVARALRAQGKRVIELEIGDSPFPSTQAGVEAGIEAIRAGTTRYCPSMGVPELRAAAADYVRREYGVQAKAENVVIGPGAKTFELLFCETFLNPGDGVLVFSPYFPTYLPNIQRRGARAWIAELRAEHQFRPQIDDVRRFLESDSQAKAIFLNSPHNPTGGVATEEDLRGIAEAIRGRDIALLSDEPYDKMVWQGRHHSILAQPGMMDQCVAAYTFSKSYSMSGWRLGFAIGHADVVNTFGTLINSALSCVPPFAQLAGAAALAKDSTERDRNMRDFGGKVALLADALDKVEGISCPRPAGTFYVFADVRQVCDQLSISSHGLAMYLLEAADDELGVACLGGECFGDAGGGFLRFSCAEPDERLLEAVAFLPVALGRRDRVQAFLETRPHFRRSKPYGS